MIPMSLESWILWLPLWLRLWLQQAFLPTTLVAPGSVMVASGGMKLESFATKTSKHPSTDKDIDILENIYIYNMM